MAGNSKKPPGDACCLQLERVGLRVGVLEKFRSEISNLVFGEHGAAGMRIDVNSLKEWRDRSEKEKAVEAAYRRRLAVVLFGLLGGTFITSLGTFLWIILQALPALKALSE